MTKLPQLDQKIPRLGEFAVRFVQLMGIDPAKGKKTEHPHDFTLQYVAKDVYLWVGGHTNHFSDGASGGAMKLAVVCQFPATQRPGNDPSAEYAGPGYSPSDYLRRVEGFDFAAKDLGRLGVSYHYEASVSVLRPEEIALSAGLYLYDSQLYPNSTAFYDGLRVDGGAIGINRYSGEIKIYEKTGNYGFTIKPATLHALAQKDAADVMRHWVGTQLGFGYLHNVPSLLGMIRLFQEGPEGELDIHDRGHIRQSGIVDETEVKGEKAKKPHAILTLLKRLLG